MQRQDKGWIKGDLSTPFQVFNLGEGSLNFGVNEVGNKGLMPLQKQ